MLVQIIKSTVDGAIVITKCITPDFYEVALANKDKLIIHATITGYGHSILEPNVPPQYEEFMMTNGIDSDMPKYDINKLRSAGLRYLAVDKDGQAWAFETIPQRAYGCHWILSDEFLRSKENGNEHWSRVLHWNLKGRRICMPVSDLPIDLKWEDEPYDILEYGLVRKEDFKIWPDFRKC